EVTDQGATVRSSVAQLPNPSARIRYTWQPGGIATKEFYDFSTNTYFSDPGTHAAPWKAIDRSRDGNTGLIFASRDTAGVQTGYVYDKLGRLTEINPPSPEFGTQIEYVDIHHTTVRQGDPAVMGSNFDCSAAAGDF